MQQKKKIKDIKEDGRAINTIGNHPYLTIIKDNEKCDEYLKNGFNNNIPQSYTQEKNCLRWVEVAELKKSSKITVPSNYKPSSLINSEVENTLTLSCFLSNLSLDQIAQPNFNANAKYCVSSWSGAINPASFLKSLYSNTGTNSTKNGSIDLYNSKIPILILAFNISSSKCLFNSSNAYLGEYNSKSDLVNNFLVNESFLKKENNIFISTTNNIYDTSFKNLSCIDFLASLPNLMQSSSVSSEFSRILSNFLSNASLLTLSDKNSLVTSDQFISGNPSIFFFKSSGIDNVIFGILTPPLNSVYDVGDVQIYKTFGLEPFDITFEEIKSIEVLDKQQVYDLAIEGTRNFIANDIVAGTINATQGTTGLRVTSDNNVLIHLE